MGQLLHAPRHRKRQAERAKLERDITLRCSIEDRRQFEVRPTRHQARGESEAKAWIILSAS